MNYLLVWNCRIGWKSMFVGQILPKGWSTETAHRWMLSKRSNGEQVAHWFGHLDAELFAHLISQVCRMYNNAFVGPGVIITDMHGYPETPGTLSDTLYLQRTAS